MPSLPRRTPATRPSTGRRAEHLDASLVPLAPEYDFGLEQPTLYNRRADSTKSKDKNIPSRAHSRSIGSLFSSSRKKIIGIDSDTDSDEDAFGNPQGGSAAKRTMSGMDTEPSLQTGTCMTCHSKVRWPKGLKLYRCTVCHCVNDLETRPQKELRKVKEVDQATWRKLNARYPNLKFPDAPYFALAVREARDIADRCMQTYVDALDDRPTAAREVRRPSADAGTTLAVRRKPGPGPGLADRRPSATALPSLPPVSPLLTPPHLTDVPNPFSTFDTYSSSPEVTTSPQPRSQRSLDPANGLHQHDVSSSSNPPPPGRQPPPPPPPPPPSADALSKVTAEQAGSSNHKRQPSLENTDTGRTVRNGPSSSERLKAAFTPLEVYLKWSYASFESINEAFSTTHRPAMARTRSEGASTIPKVEEPLASQGPEVPLKDAWYLSEVNGKTLLVGDVAENATLWTGAAGDTKSQRKAANRTLSGKALTRTVTHRSPCIQWDSARDWHHAVLDAGQRWRQRRPASDVDVSSVDPYLEKLLYKASESLLRRPGRPLSEPEDLRFLMIMLTNPLLYRTASQPGASDKPPAVSKRILGLLARSGKRALRYLEGWLINMDNNFYQDLLELCKRYMHYRLLRDVVPQEDKKANLIREVGGEQQVTLRQAPRELANIDGDTESNLSYFDDWGLSSAAAFLFALWNANLSKPTSVRLPCNSWYNLFFDSMGEGAIKQDFTAWETRKPAFTFCYFPFLISMSAKITILTFDANRQQMDEARKAWHQQFNTAEAVSQNFHVRVRRDCLATDSLRSISEAAGSASHHKELKKGLRIHFEGEEGVDAGGLRKEFFLLLLRELLDPNHGLVEYDERSNYCYFNPSTFEESAQYFLLGTLIGLAIYNGTILDIPFPPLLFKKLLKNDPSVSAGESSSMATASSAMDYSLDDLAQWRPSLAHGFRQLLDYDANVEQDLGLTFVLELDRYGSHVSVPLAGRPLNTSVTNDNREQYVRAYMQYLMHDSVSRQFEPFKRGFFAVCGGNALSLFQPEELELLVRGSDEALDVNVLKAVSVHEGWNRADPTENVPVIRWFWDFFHSLGHKDQRKLLGFITGSDRVPALGEANLIIKLQYAGDDQNRLPVARTCFNVLQLQSYNTKEELQEKLWQAVTGSEGFLLK